MNLSEDRVFRTHFDSVNCLSRKGVSWKVKTTRGGSDWEKYTVVVLRNGREVFRKTWGSPEDPSLYTLARVAAYPVPYPVLIIAQHSGIGHHQSNSIYRWTGHTFRLIHDYYPDLGGPVFRDMDGDGRMEWLWDDNNHYEYYGKPPKWIFVYKDHGARLVLWKKLPNKRKLRLPITIGLSF